MAQLVGSLQSEGCGVEFKDGAGTVHSIPCLLIVDDVVLLASDRHMLQKVLVVADGWARKVRLRWNLGTSKSAILLFGCGLSEVTRLLRLVYMCVGGEREL